jgi:hypothetical protein
VIRTTDGGATWNTAPLALVEFVNSLAIQPGAPNRLLVGTWEGLWESMDRGATFHPTAPGLAGFSIRDVAFSTSNPTLVWVIKSPEGVQRSSDGGNTFVQANGGMGNDVHEIVVREIGGARTLFAILSGTEVYQSTNDGDSWSPMNAGLELSGGVGTLVWQPMADRLLAGTPRGLFALELETTAVVSDDAAPSASGLRLVGPWPNPLVAGGDMTLELFSPRATPTTISIYDAAGRWVRELLGREPGGTRIQWDGRNARGEPVASGTYFVRVSAPGQELVRKVQIVR